MKKQLPIVALIYDFDGTLAPGNMQEYDFLKEIGIEDKSMFWDENNKLSVQQDASEILSYMKLMIDKSNNVDNPRPITRNTFRKYGNNIKLFKGVKEWFELTQKLGDEIKFRHSSHNKLRHYYIMRNRLYYNYKYNNKNKALVLSLLQTLKQVFLIVLFENDKLNKLKMLKTAINDFFNNNMGKKEINTSECR